MDDARWSARTTAKPPSNDVLVIRSRYLRGRARCAGHGIRRQPPQSAATAACLSDAAADASTRGRRNWRRRVRRRGRHHHRRRSDPEAADGATAGSAVLAVETFPTLQAARAAEKPSAVSVEAEGKGWLFTLGPKGGTFTRWHAVDRDWTCSGAQLVGILAAAPGRASAGARLSPSTCTRIRRPETVLGAMIFGAAVCSESCSKYSTSWAPEQVQSRSTACHRVTSRPLARA